MNDDKDNLNSLIEEFSKINPSQGQMNRWVKVFTSPVRTPYFFSAGLAAGMIIGLIGGGLFFRSSNLQIDTEPEYSATFASITVKYQPDGGN